MPIGGVVVDGGVTGTGVSCEGVLGVPLSGFVPVGEFGVSDDGVGIVPGVVGVSLASGRDGEVGVSTGGAVVDGWVFVPGVDLGYVDGAGVLGVESGLWEESGTVDGVDVPGTDGVDWDGVPVDGAGAEDGAL